MRRVLAGFGRVRGRLVAVAVGLPLAETALLVAFAPDTALPLAGQVTAPEPFGLFHDLRWLFVYHPNALAFAAEALLLIAFRTTVTAVLVRAAWPSGVPPPSWSRAFSRSLAFTAVAAVILSPWAALAFGIAVMSLSWLFFVAIPLTLVLAVFVHHAVVTGSPWWRTPPLRGTGWILLAFVVHTAGGGAISGTPRPVAFVTVGALGIFNARAWVGVVGGAVARRPARARLPWAPIGVALMVIVAAVGTNVGFERGRPHHPARDVAFRAPAGARPVLVVSGFGSGWDGTPQRRFPGAFDERRFSYRGVAGGRPVEYAPADTLRSLPDLTATMARQVDALAAQSGRRVSIVAESEGALVAKTYLAAHSNAPVDRLVMLSPLVRPGRVYYPPDGADGWGVAASWELRGLAAVVRTLTPLEISTDTDLFRSVTDHGPALQDAMACDTPGVEELTVAPVADAVASPDPATAGTRVVYVPEFHGGLLGNGDVQRLVANELRGVEPAGSPAWSTGDRVVRALAATWQVPDLAVSMNPAWDAFDPDAPDCLGARRALLRWAQHDPGV